MQLPDPINASFVYLNGIQKFHLALYFTMMVPDKNSTCDAWPCTWLYLIARADIFWHPINPPDCVILPTMSIHCEIRVQVILRIIYPMWIQIVRPKMSGDDWYPEWPKWRSPSGHNLFCGRPAQITYDSFHVTGGNLMLCWPVLARSQISEHI